MRLAVGLKRVDPADVPPSARPTGSASASAAPPGTQLKRKADGAPVPGPSGTQQKTRTVRIDDDIEEIVPEQEEVKDELYVMMRTNVVGIQYYKGGCMRVCVKCVGWAKACAGLVGPGEEVRLVREPTNQYDRCVLSSVVCSAGLTRLVTQECY